MSDKAATEYTLKLNISKPLFWAMLGGVVLFGVVLPIMFTYAADGHVPHLDHANALLDLPLYFGLGIQVAAWLGGLVLGANGRKLPIAWGLFLGGPIAFLMLIVCIFLDHPLFGRALLSG